MRQIGRSAATRATCRTSWCSSTGRLPGTGRARPLPGRSWAAGAGDWMLAVPGVIAWIFGCFAFRSRIKGDRLISRSSPRPSRRWPTRRSCFSSATALTAKPGAFHRQQPFPALLFADPGIPIACRPCCAAWPELFIGHVPPGGHHSIRRDVSSPTPSRSPSGWGWAGTGTGIGGGGGGHRQSVAFSPASRNHCSSWACCSSSSPSTCPRAWWACGRS